MQRERSQISKRVVDEILSDSDSDHSDEIEIIETNEILNNPAQKNSTNEASSTVGKSLNSSECPICFDSLEVAVVTPCGHMFCNECIFKAFGHSRNGGSRNQQGTCALCRKNLKFSSLIYLKMKKGPG